VSTAEHRNPTSRPLSPEYPLLGLLMDAPNHGYELHQRLKAELGNIWHVSQSQAYSILKRLQKRGDVAVGRRTPNEVPRRQMLQITPSGKRRFKQWLEGGASSRAHTIRLEFLTRLYFAKNLMPAKIPKIYAQQAREISRTTRRLRLALRAVPESQKSNRMSLDLRLRQLEVVHQWLRETRESVQRKEKN
jgi:DNA-binding PadR family transcriptional regulator